MFFELSENLCLQTCLFINYYKFSLPSPRLVYILLKAFHQYIYVYSYVKVNGTNSINRSSTFDMILTNKLYDALTICDTNIEIENKNMNNNILVDSSKNESIYFNICCCRLPIEILVFLIHTMIFISLNCQSFAFVRLTVRVVILEGRFVSHFNLFVLNIDGFF